MSEATDDQDRDATAESDFRRGKSFLPLKDRLLVSLFVGLLAATLIFPVFEFDAGMMRGIRIFSGFTWAKGSGLVAAVLFAIGFICGHWVTCYVTARLLAAWIAGRFQMSLLSVMVATAVVGVGLTCYRLTVAPVSLILFCLGPAFTLLGSAAVARFRGVARLNVAWTVAAVVALIANGLALTIGFAKW